MSTLVDPARPVLRLLFGDVGRDVGSLRICYRQPVHMDQRLHRLIFGKLPDVAGVRAEETHDVPAVVDHEESEESVLHRMEVASQKRAAALAPEDAAHFRMRGQIALNALALVLPEKLAANVFELR